MIFTLADAVSFLGTFVDNGTCDRTTVVRRINEIVRRLIPKVTAARLVQTVRIRTYAREFPLPREAEKLLQVDINGTPANVFGPAYQFMAAGPGDLDLRSDNGMRQIMDLGEKCYMFPVPIGPSGYKLVAFATEVDDTGAQLFLKGVDVLNGEIRSRVTEAGVATSLIQGQYLTVNRFKGGVEGEIGGPISALSLTTSNFFELMQVHKPVTKGYITLYAVDAATNEMWLIGKYHPNETIPMFRRYRITMKGTCDTTEDTNILCRVKMKYVPASDDNDVLALDSLDAMKAMCLAINAENVGNLQMAVAYEGQAARLLEEQLSQTEQSTGAFSIVDLVPKMTGAGFNRYWR